MRNMKGRKTLDYPIREGTLVIELKRMHRIISSAPHGGGILRARSILNHQVPANPASLKPAVADRWRHPARDLGLLAGRLKVRRPVIGLMTAVPMPQLVVDREQCGRIWVECFCPVRVTHAV